MKLCAFADEASPLLEKQIAALNRNAISLLEIRGVGEKNIKDVTSAEAEEIKKRLDEAGISVWSIGSPIGKISLDGDMGAHLDDFKRILESAEIFGTNHIRIFSFFPIAGESEEKTRKRVFENMEKLLSLAPAHIVLCHENEKDIFGQTLENCLWLHKEFPRLRAVFDPANFVQCGVETIAAWDMLKEYVEYLHIKDALADGSVVPAGAGIGNLPEIAADYLLRGGEVMTLEPHLKVFKGLAELENGKSVKHGLFVYKNNDESFDAAVLALRKILK